MLLRLADVKRPSCRRRFVERTLNGPDAVLQAHGRYGHLLFIAVCVRFRGSERLRDGWELGIACFSRARGSGLRPRAVLDLLDEHAAPSVLERDGACLRHLLHEVAEAVDAVLALREGRVELQQGALQQPELRSEIGRASCRETLGMCDEQ